MRAYVFDGYYLSTRLLLESPLPVVSLAVSDKLFPATMIDGSEEFNNIPQYTKKDFRYMFKSYNNDVIIYGNVEPLDLIEHALVKTPLFTKEEFMFQPYRVEAKLTYQNRGMLENIIKKAIDMGRKQKNDKADSVIAEVISKEIDMYFRCGV